MNLRYARPLGLIALPFISACATAGGSGTSTCVSDLSASTSPLGEVLDSASVQGRLESMWPARSGLAVARLGGGSGPDPDPVSVWSESLNELQKDEIASLLLAGARMPLEGDDRAYLVLGDDDGPTLRRVDRLAQCAPRIFNRTRLADRIAAEARGLTFDQRVVVRLYVFVAASGLAEEVRVAESSGDFNVDRAAARVFDGVNFTPARVEGIPVAVWAAFPVTFNPR